MQLPPSYHIDRDEGVITINGGDRIDGTELATLGEQVLTDARYDPLLPQLVDLRGCRFDLGDRAVIELGRYLARRYGEQVAGRMAVVIDTDLASATTATIYRLTSALGNAELFEDYAFALRWMMRRSARQKPDSRAEAGHNGPE